MSRTREERKRLYTEAAQIIRERGLLQNGNYASNNGERCVVGALLEANGNDWFADDDEVGTIHFHDIKSITWDGVLTAEVTKKLFGGPRDPRAIYRWNDDLPKETATDTAAALLEELAKDLS